MTTEIRDVPAIIEAGEYHPTADITLYPVYARTEIIGSPIEKTASVTISSYASENDWSGSNSDGSGEQYETVVIDDNVTATASGGAHTGQYYSSDGSWRLYQTEDATLVIATNSGTLKSFTITYDVKNEGDILTYEGNEVSSGSVVTIDDDLGEVTLEVSGNASNGQIRIEAISVTYIANGSIKTYYNSLSSEVTLAETTDNSEVLEFLNGKSRAVTLMRTLQKTYWNTFCVPFSTANPDGWTVKKLTGSDYDERSLTLTLNFGDAESIEAGKPYLVKVGNDDVVSSTFEDVTIVKGTTETETTYVNFVPVMNPITLSANDENSVLYLGRSNKLYFPKSDVNVNGFRAYFQLNNGLFGSDNVDSARSIVLNLGNGETTNIRLIDNGQWIMDNSVYDLQGRRMERSTFNVQRSTFNVQRSTFNVKEGCVYPERQEGGDKVTTS